MPKQRLNPVDAIFLQMESPTIAMHVASLLLFSPPSDASPTFLRDLLDEAKSHASVGAPWNLKLSSTHLRNPLNKWITDDNFDVEYHLRRSALPGPGDERELGTLVSRLHSHHIDFSRPPWEMHLIEGLDDGRFAIYTKMHHALVDGYTGMQMLIKSLTTDPDARDTAMFFTQRPTRERHAKVDDHTRSRTIPDLNALLGAATGPITSTARVTRAVTRLRPLRTATSRQPATPLEAPMTMLNHGIGKTRRFATQQYPMSELRAIARASDATLNDVLLAICAGGLRRYLEELDQLPRKPLVGFLPVNVRTENDSGGGNAVGAMLASLATDVADPLERLAKIVDSTRSGKAQMNGMSQQEIIAYSAALLSPLFLQVARGMNRGRGIGPVAFNVCISNVPGPTEPLYFRGARLDASYPLSIPLHGMALNITCHSYANHLNLGFIGCRDAVPHLQRLAVHCGQAYDELRGRLPATT